MSYQALSNFGVSATQVSKIISPQNPHDLLVFLTNNLLAVAPGGWSGSGGYFQFDNSGNALTSVTTSGNSGSTTNWVNVFASFTTNGSPVEVQNQGISSGSWSSGTTLSALFSSNVAAGDAIFVTVQATTGGNDTTPPTITDSNGNIYITVGIATFDSISNFNSGAWLFMAQNNATGPVTVHVTTHAFMSSGNMLMSDWSGVTGVTVPFSGVGAAVPLLFGF
jgi:hypothetical protein